MSSKQQKTPYLLNFGRKITLGFGILVLILMVLVASIGAQFYAHTSQQNEQELQETLTRLLAHSINRISFSGKYHARLLVKQITESHPRIAYISVVNPENKVIASSNREGISPGFSTESLQRVLRNQNTVFKKLTIQNHTIQQIAMPYHSGYQDQIGGVIFVGILIDQVIEAKRVTQLLMVGLILILSLISLVATYFLSQKFAAPVVRLALQFKGILEHVPLLIQISDQNGKIYESSASFEEFIQQHPDILQNELQDVFQNQKQVEREVVYQASDQELIFLITSFPITDQHHKDILACSIALDISNRKEMERELKKARNYISNIINSMPSILVGVDLMGNITQWNLEAERILEIPAGEAIGENINQMIPYLTINMEHIQEAINTREVYLKPKQSHQKKGEIHYENVTIYPLIANGVQGAVIRIDDVTKEYKLEEQLNHSRRMDAIGQLAGGVAHDFNNMLAGIMGAAQLLKLPGKGVDQKGIELIDLMIESITRASDLTSKLLAFGRKGKITSTTVHIHSMIDDAIALLSRTIDRRVTILSEKTAENDLVTGDLSTLQNIIINLGINAAHAMPDGGTLTISTEIKQLNENDCYESSFNITPGDYIQIDVQDTGTGIPEHHLSKIFEPFFTTKPQGKGTGLGLAAVYGTILEHHGSITVSSRENEGTTFSILLPSTIREIKSINDPENRLTGSGTILLVDDEEILRVTGKAILEDLGYTVFEAENGLKAVTLFQKRYREINCVIMDMVMPEMSGYDAFLKMIQIDPSCKVIISSGFTQSKNIDELKKQGLSGFIPKPFKDHQLSQLLNKVIKG